ncbi:MAG: repeat protein, partial [Flavipsychrobacter sp.]|nr:repeat protein [Flavipsychrobacter sp.]
LINDQVKAHYFNNIVDLYFSNRQKYIDKLLMQGSPNCSHCALARMTLNVGAVISPAPYPLGFTGTTTDTAFTGMPGSGGVDGTTWMAGVLRDSDLTVYDSTLMARMQDTVALFYNSTSSSMAYAVIDSIMANLGNCISGNSTLAADIKDTLVSIYLSGAAPMGNFVPQQIRYALTTNGVAMNDICNQYIIDCYQFGTQPPTPVNDCLPQAVYTGQAVFMNAAATLTALTIPGRGMPQSYVLDTVTNAFEKNMGRALGNRNSTDLIGSYDVPQHLYKIDVVATGTTDTVAIYLHSPSYADFFATPGASFVITVDCSNTVPSLAMAKGYIGEFSFTANVQATAGLIVTNSIMTGWADRLQTMVYRSNAISACVPCTQMRELYTQFADTLIADSVYGSDHPYYDIMLANFMNAHLGQLYTSADYKTFIQSCALADSAVIPLYTGYATYSFANRTAINSFITALNAVDPLYNFDNCYRDSDMVSHVERICIDLNKVPLLELWQYKNMLNGYAGSFVAPKNVNKPLSALQPAREIGILYYPDAFTAINPADSNVIDTSTAKFFGSQRGVWIAGSYVMRNFFDVVANTGASPASVSNNAYLLAEYANKMPGVVFIPCDMSTIDADYYKVQKKAFLTYNYKYQQLPAYAVLDSIQAQFLTSRIPSWSGYTASYTQPFHPGAPSNLYLGDATMNNRFYDTLQAIISQAGTGGYIFHTARSVNVPLTAPKQLDAYICSDESYWYRYFTTGDTLYNAYVSFPAYIPKYLRSSYHVAGAVVPVPYDSLNRSFILNLVRTGTTDTLQVYGRASFVIGKSIELDNVLLGNAATSSNVRTADTFNNCERQLLFSSINQGITNHNIYMDSVRTEIKGAFANYLATGVQEELELGYWNDEFSYTLYNYDRAGNLILTAPPAGVTPIANTGHLLTDVDTMRANNMLSAPTTPVYNKKNTYEYSSTDQVTAQNTIDGGTTAFYYDAAGRLIFSQNAKQVPGNLFTYNLYDKQGRIIETGQRTWPGGVAPYLVTHPNMVSAEAVSLLITLGPANRYDVVRTIYDTAAADLGTISGQDAQQNLRKRVSCVKYFDTLLAADSIFANYTFASHYSYDIHGNVQTLVQDFPEMDDHAHYGFPASLQQQYKRIDYDYDQVSGKVNMLSYNRGRSDQFYQQYEYDIQNRITKVQTSSDGFLWQQEAAYKYYQHGPLARVVLNNPYVQGMDFAYTIQGWLKAMNNDTLDANEDMGMDGADVSTTKDAAAYALDYFTGDYNPVASSHMVQHFHNITRNLYNGNIAAQTDAISNFQKLHKQYVYDQLNRIHSATYHTVDAVYNGISPITDFRSHYDYDADGNITSLVRFGNDRGTGAQMMDSLIYSYTNPNTNKLYKLYDYSPNNYSGTAGSLDIAFDTTSATTKYHYDAIGNTIQDLVSGQDTIEWNMYNKVSRTVNNTDGSELQFGYDGAGNRVVKKYIKYLSGGSIRLEKKDYYVHDAQGNILATYHHTDTLSNATGGWVPTYRKFYLAEHSIYGSNRLGIRKYYPGQFQLVYDMNRLVPPTPGFTDTMLWQHIPWYSLEYQDVIKTDSLNLYGNTHTDSLFLTTLVGQRRYEVNDHLGNVLATVSDKRDADNLAPPLTPGDPARVLTWKPIVPNAYDYYPFGQYMPGRWRGDTGTQCYTIVKPAISTSPGVPASYPFTSISTLVPGPYFFPGSASLTPMGGGTIDRLTTNIAGAGVHFNLVYPVAPGIPQTVSVTVTYYATIPYTIEVVDGTSRAFLGWQIISSGVPLSAIVSIPITPTSSSIAIEVMEGGIIGGSWAPPPHYIDLYNVSYDTTSTTATIVSTTICDEDGYLYGYNGQMKVNEIAGLGNHNTSLFGEFDTRTGRRWNQDPKPNASVSNYATFNNSPIWKSDPNGDDPGWPNWLLALRKSLGYLEGPVHDRNYTMGDGWMFEGPEAAQNRANYNNIQTAKVEFFADLLLPEIAVVEERIAITRIRDIDLGFGKSVKDPETIGFSTNNIKADRQRAVSQAWKQERNMVKNTGRGTVDWTESQQHELITTGKVKGYEGHHINSVNGHPEMAGNPNNIKFVTRQENLDLHGGNFQNPTTGPLIERESGLKPSK